MGSIRPARQNPAWVAIDVAKNRHDALVEAKGGRRRLTISNTLEDFNKLANELRPHGKCEIAIQRTGDDHRPLANFLIRQGYHVHFVSSIATNRTREALFNSWDKNDPKDAQVILHLLKSGTTQTYADPLEAGTHDLQEPLGTYRQVVDRKTRVYHSLQTHYLPLYFPEAAPSFGSPRAEWFLEFFARRHARLRCLRMKKAFVKMFTAKGGRITMRRRLVADYYEAAKESVGIPVTADSWAVQMFEFTIEQYLRLTKQRRKLEATIHAQLEAHSDYPLLRSIPGIGPIIALTVFAEGGDLGRFSHYRKFLNYCGFSLSTMQSGNYRGSPQLSKRGNARPPLRLLDGC